MTVNVFVNAALTLCFSCQLFLYFCCFLLVTAKPDIKYDSVSTIAPTTSSPCSLSVLLEESEPVYSSSIVPFTRSKLNLVTFAAQLSSFTYNGDSITDLGTDARFFDAGADAAITFSTDVYCFIAFRGSIDPRSSSISSLKYLYQDWIQQNLDMDSYYVTKRDNGTNDDATSLLTNEGCNVHEGFYEAYAGIGKGNIYEFVDMCMAPSKSSIKKQLIITGHSQGGASAAIASIELSDYDPLVITFGSPTFLKSNYMNADCPGLNQDRIWRFVNTEPSVGGLQYDPIPFLELYEPVFGLDVIGSQVGASIHLPPDSKGSDQSDTANLLYRSVNDTKTYMSLSNLDVNAHMIEQYVAKLCYLVQYAIDDQLDVSGYSLGTPCTNDEECSSFVLQGIGGCVHNYCSLEQQQQLALVDEPCRDRIDCESNRCDFTWTGNKVCYNQKSSGSICNEGSNCQSGTCTWSWTCQ